MWKATPADCIGDQHIARGDKWALTIVSSITTAAGGVSAGVAIAARSNFGLARSRAQLHAAWCPGVVRGGIHLASAYLWTGEAPSSARSRALFEAIAELLDALDGPWVLSAEWQSSPEVVSHAGMPSMLRGVLFAQSLPTCGAEVLGFCFWWLKLCRMPLSASR